MRLAYSSPQLHTNTALVDEFDAGGFEGFPQYFEGAFVRRPGFALEGADSRYADRAAVGQVYLLPFEKRAGRTALGRGDHVRI